MANAWMNHVKAVKKQHPKKSLKEVLKMAAKSYKKGPSTKKNMKGKKVKKAKTVRRSRKGKKSRSHRK